MEYTHSYETKIFFLDSHEKKIFKKIQREEMQCRWSPGPVGWRLGRAHRLTRRHGRTSTGTNAVRGPHLERLENSKKMRLSMIISLQRTN